MALNRRHFLKYSGMGILPAATPLGAIAAPLFEKAAGNAPSSGVVNFFGDGWMMEPGEYLQQLQEAHAAAAIQKDRYGEGGVVAALEQEFAALTGKEKAIFMPSGTMANQLALAVLSGEKTKIFVQDTSHVYRDEADAAQSVFQKRLLPLAPGQAWFTAQQLEEAIEALKVAEAFPSGIGAVSIENPVRRSEGRFVPLEEIKKIRAYCTTKGIPMHLDGARLFMAAAWSGVPVKEYSAHFDTVYISLYKYLGASGGAVLCGPADIIGQMPHLIKVHGGNMYGNWTNAAMALYRLEGFEERLQRAKAVAGDLFRELNRLPQVKVSPLPGGTNIYSLQLSAGTDGSKLQRTLNQEYQVRMMRPDASNRALIYVNETLLHQSPDAILKAFTKSL